MSTDAESQARTSDLGVDPRRAGAIFCASVSCNDNNECTEDACDPDNSICVHSPVTQALPCNQQNSCERFACLPNEATCSYVGPLQCDDEQICTTDACDPVGGCFYTPNTKPCELMDPCALGRCSDGVCQKRGVVNCDDDNPCTVDACGPEGCQHDSLANGTSCEDGDPCTVDSICAFGNCDAGSIVCP